MSPTVNAKTFRFGRFQLLRCGIPVSSVLVTLCETWTLWVLVWFFGDVPYGDWDNEYWSGSGETCVTCDVWWVIEVNGWMENRWLSEHVIGELGLIFFRLGDIDLLKLWVMVIAIWVSSVFGYVIEYSEIYAIPHKIWDFSMELGCIRLIRANVF